MPELPEVETIVNDLKSVIVDDIFLDIVSSCDEMVVTDVLEFLALKSCRIVDIKRRGKFISIFFENDFVLTIHLRMTGSLVFSERDAGLLIYERIRFNFMKCCLVFCDIRKFGKVWLCKKVDYEGITGIFRLGIEALDENLVFDDFAKLIRAGKGAIKKILLDQSVIAGIGNIYADEMLFLACVRPDTEVEFLNDSMMEDLYVGMRTVLMKGIANRGTSFSDYRDVFARKGNNQRSLNVYGRSGLECHVCKNRLSRMKIAGRSTVYCDSCQI